MYIDAVCLEHTDRSLHHFVAVFEYLSDLAYERYHGVIHNWCSRCCVVARHTPRVTLIIQLAFYITCGDVTNPCFRMLFGLPSGYVPPTDFGAIGARQRPPGLYRCCDACFYCCFDCCC